VDNDTMFGPSLMIIRPSVLSYEVRDVYKMHLIAEMESRNFHLRQS